MMDDACSIYTPSHTWMDGNTGPFVGAGGGSNEEDGPGLAGTSSSTTGRRSSKSHKRHLAFVVIHDDHVVQLPFPCYPSSATWEPAGQLEAEALGAIPSPLVHTANGGGL